MGYIVFQARSGEQQFAAVRHLQQRGFGCTYDYQLEASQSDKRHPWDRRRHAGHYGEPRELWLKWPRDMLGDDFFDKIVSVTVTKSPTTKDLEAYRVLRHVQSLNVYVDQDDDLRDLAAGRRLTDLSVYPPLYYRSQGISSDCIGEILGQQRRLKELTISLGRQLRAMTPELWKAIVDLPNLEKLTIGNCDLTGKTFGALKNLNSMSILNCDIPADCNLGSLGRLRAFSVRDSNVNDQWLSGVNLPLQVEALNVCKTEITTEGLRLLRNHRLKYLTIGTAQVTATTSSDLAALPTLEYVLIEGRELAGKKEAINALAQALPNVKFE